MHTWSRATWNDDIIQPEVGIFIYQSLYLYSAIDKHAVYRGSGIGHGGGGGAGGVAEYWTGSRRRGVRSEDGGYGNDRGPGPWGSKLID
jgi:hypothetical protein